MRSKKSHVIITHDGDFTLLQGKDYSFLTRAGLIDILPEDEEEDLVVIKYIHNKYGFNVSMYDRIQEGAWQVFDTREERDSKALEYQTQVCDPINEHSKNERMRKRGYHTQS